MCYEVPGPHDSPQYDGALESLPLLVSGSLGADVQSRFSGQGEQKIFPYTSPCSSLTAFIWRPATCGANAQLTLDFPPLCCRPYEL